MKVSAYQLYQFYVLTNFGKEITKSFVYFAYTLPEKRLSRSSSDPRTAAYYVDVIDVLTGAVRTDLPVNRLQPIEKSFDETSIKPEILKKINKYREMGLKINA
jgi:hypothetical protein